MSENTPKSIFGQRLEGEEELARWVSAKSIPGKKQGRTHSTSDGLLCSAGRRELHRKWGKEKRGGREKTGGWYPMTESGVYRRQEGPC